ncbi:hypothetical protein A3747_14860 [Sulfitobacter sp. HI0076]|nr:hypothetical protein A3720_11755 [Sulfitobacter sp. HI0021]KZY00163.1 hypothetical protein A3722_11425 [Sulfitobacter sp. HI0027]KZZ02630.1 hypothetical protein A3747_14860 [Sulfitobacter sp. HI0076]
MRDDVIYLFSFNHGTQFSTVDAQWIAAQMAQASRLPRGQTVERREGNGMGRLPRRIPTRRKLCKPPRFVIFAVRETSNGQIITACRDAHFPQRHREPPRYQSLRIDIDSDSA